MAIRQRGIFVDAGEVGGPRTIPVRRPKIKPPPPITVPLVRLTSNQTRPPASNARENIARHDPDSQTASGNTRQQSSTSAASSDEKNKSKLLYAEANWNDDDDDYLDIPRGYSKPKVYEETQENYLLNTIVGLTQGVILDVVFGVDLTAETSGQVRNWTAWMEDPDRINSAYQATLRNAQMYNEIAAMNGFLPPNPTWLFRNLNGPVELRLVESLGDGFYGQTIPMQSVTKVRGEDDVQTLYRWGAVRNAIQAGGEVEGRIYPTEILLTDPAFSPGTVTPKGGSVGLQFNDDFIIDHEYGHVSQTNWQFTHSYMGARFQEIAEGMGLNVQDWGLGLPGIGARSSLENYEFLADALALLATDGFDVNDPSQQIMMEAAQQVMWELMQVKLLGNPG